MTKQFGRAINAAWGVCCMPDQTKDRIVDAAYRALVKRGYHETAMKALQAAPR